MFLLVFVDHFCLMIATEAEQSADYLSFVPFETSQLYGIFLFFSCFVSDVFVGKYKVLRYFLLQNGMKPLLSPGPMLSNIDALLIDDA